MDEELENQEQGQNEENQEEINLDTLSDDDIDSILEAIDNEAFEGIEDPEGAEDMIASSENEDNDDDSDTDGDDSSESDADADDEDTDLENEDSDDDDTNGEDDDSGDDTSDDENEGSEENSPVDSTDDNKDSEDAETKDQDGDPDEDTVKLDKTEFEKYKDFYEKVANAEFKANGKTVKGFTDPEKIIQAQQMSYGFSDKMAGFKKYRPFLDPLQKNGMIDDPDKFNLAMDIISGDKEAIKKHIKDLELDPVVDLDMENLAYTGKNHTASKQTLALEDAIEAARNLGVEDKVKEVIGKQWDDESFNEFVEDPHIRRDLLNDISSGAFDRVQEKISEIKRLDFNGDFSSMKSTDQYRAAVGQLKAEMARQQSQEPEKKSDIGANDAKVEAEKQRIIEERKQAEYKQKAEQEKKKADEQRRKASTVSRKKAKSKPKPKFDPMNLKGDELDAFVDSLINEGRA